VENPARTSKYLSEREARLSALRAELAELFRGRGGGHDGAHERVVLEIGCGHGHFLTAYAAAHPRAFCVGFDIELDRITRAGRKRKRAELEKNLAFVRAEASEFFAALPEHARFSDVFVLFPDPWPKRRHHKNRMIRAEILSALAAHASGAGSAGSLPAKMGADAGAGANTNTPSPTHTDFAGKAACAPGGGAPSATRLYFRTDYAPYFADARQTIAEHPAWEIAPADTPWPFEFQTVFQERAAGFQSLIAFSSSGKSAGKT